MPLRCRGPLRTNFIMLDVLRYYESAGATREEKVKETLETMGASILVGGLSTFLGVIPLAFSTSAILRTVFTAFFAMVTLGLTHGLILLPVVLSLLGPTACIQPHTIRANTKIRVNMIDDLQLTRNNTDETASFSEVGSKTSDLHSVSSSCQSAPSMSDVEEAHSVSSEEQSSSYQSAPSMSDAEEEEEDCEIIRIQPLDACGYDLKCTDIVEC